LLAIDRGKPGIFNIAEDDGFVSIAKALRELNFDPGFRLKSWQAQVIARHPEKDGREKNIGTSGWLIAASMAKGIGRALSEM
jgi:hypothetical protein